MPRPIDTSSKNVKMLVGGGIAAALVVVGLTLAMCSTMGTSGTSNTASNTASGAAASSSTTNSTSDLMASVTKQIDEVGNKAAVQFMSDTDQEAFAKALQTYLESNGRTWPDGATIASVKNQTTTTAEIYIKLSDGSYIVCIWVAGTANAFTFDASSEAEALGAGTSHSSSAGSSSSDTGSTADSGSTGSGTGTSSNTGSASSSSSTASPSSGGTSSSGTSGSSSSGSSGKTPSNVSRPVKASDTQTLLSSLPQKAAYYLPTVTENWLTSKGISVSGGDAVVDAATISQGGVGYTFSGYVKDRSGTVHSLEWEWNESRQMYGMKLV